MANVALNKRVLENWGNPNEATNGNITNYDDYRGFAYDYWPSTFTLDLEQIYSLHTIRFLLWDGLGEGHKERDTRTYKYRLLTSINQNEWIVHHDTGNEGYNGWQEFEFPAHISARFIRIHALKNSRNNEFHIVEIEAHDSKPPILEAQITNHRIISKSDEIKEIGDAFPISSKISSIVHELESLTERKIIHPDLLNETINNLQIQARDVDSIERSLDSVRREIIGPVNTELEKARQLGKYSAWGFGVGIIGGIIGIISILISLYFSYQSQIGWKSEYQNTQVIPSLADKYQVELLTYAWDRALGLHNFNLLKQLYNDTVSFNGLNITKDNLLEEKSKDFYNRRYYQYINKDGKIVINRIGEMFCDVSVPVIVQEKDSLSLHMTCNLSFRKMNTIWKITKEEWSPKKTN